MMTHLEDTDDLVGDSSDPDHTTRKTSETAYHPPKSIASIRREKHDGNCTCDTGQHAAE
jgi:hypothetical protein